MNLVTIQKSWPLLTVRIQLNQANKYLVYQLADSEDLFGRLVAISDNVVNSNAKEVPHVLMNANTNCQSYLEMANHDCTLLSPTICSSMFDIARTTLQPYLVRNWPDFSFKSMVLRKLGNHMVSTILR